MEDYEGKSFEELRMEDYLANRKGPEVGTIGATGFRLWPSAGTGLFGSVARPPTGLFGQTTAKANETKSLFGFGQPASAGFRVNANQRQSSFLPIITALGSTSTDANNPFAAKIAFRQTAAPSLFAQRAATSAIPAFGQTNTGFGGLPNNTYTQQQSSLTTDKRLLKQINQLSM
ncbi:nuclear pore complex protein Nup98-Nup96-like [Glossina fuscipes fuscipes]